MKMFLIGTHNNAKKKFIRGFLDSHGVSSQTLDECNIASDVEETGSTYEENALLKAITYAKESGMPTIADDSGLEIDALNGAPGIYSARFAGKNKSDKEKALYVLSLLDTIPPNKRTARFISVVAYAEPSGFTAVFKGISEGTIATHIQGAIHPSFPYYSIYIPKGHLYTISELVDNNIPFESHRAKALTQWIDFIAKI